MASILDKALLGVEAPLELNHSRLILEAECRLPRQLLDRTHRPALVQLHPRILELLQILERHLGPLQPQASLHFRKVSISFAIS